MAHPCVSTPTTRGVRIPLLKRAALETSRCYYCCCCCRTSETLIAESCLRSGSCGYDLNAMITDTRPVQNNTWISPRLDALPPTVPFPLKRPKGRSESRRLTPKKYKGVKFARDVVVKAKNTLRKVATTKASRTARLLQSNLNNGVGSSRRKRKRTSRAPEQHANLKYLHAHGNPATVVLSYFHFM